MIRVKKLLLCSLLLSFTACSAPEEAQEIVLLQANDTTLLVNNTQISPYSFSENLETIYDTKPIETVLRDADSTRSGYSWHQSRQPFDQPMIPKGIYFQPSKFQALRLTQKRHLRFINMERKFQLALISIHRLLLATAMIVWVVISVLMVLPEPLQKFV